MARGILARLLAMLLLLMAAVAGTIVLALIGNYTAIITGAAAGIAVWQIIVLFGNNTRKVTFMFNSIENEDYAFRFGGNRLSRSDRRFNDALNRIKTLMEQTRTAIAEKERYYEKILDRSTSALLVIDPSTGIVFQTNSAALELFCIQSLTHVNQLSIVAREIPQALLSIAPGDSRSVSFYNEAQQVCLTLAASTIELHERKLKLITMSDIGSQIDNAQIESFARLSRVLTHEIMNSLAPITSLSEQLLTTTSPTDMHRGLEIIRSTGQGLLSFVESYRSLTRVPTPVITEFNLLPFLERTVQLLDAKVDLSSVTNERTIHADENLICQVVTNLIKNATQACTGGGEIWVIDRVDNRGRVMVEVCNSGEGIPPEVRENIFVPFFTTRQGGSGIGLSLSRQIMRLHGGTISCSQFTHPVRGLATVFALTF
ncbi:MAG: HAMP domain-containing sensor histidine kinase [Mucinivorans sp.]